MATLGADGIMGQCPHALISFGVAPGDIGCVHCGCTMVPVYVAKEAQGIPIPLMIAAANLAAVWDALCRCVDEFEPGDMAACAERRDDLDDAVLRVIGTLHGRGRE